MTGQAALWRLTYAGTVRYTCDPSELARFIRTHGAGGVTREASK